MRRRGKDALGPRKGNVPGREPVPNFVAEVEVDTTAEGEVTFVSLKDETSGDCVTVATSSWDKISAAVASLRRGRTGEFDSVERAIIPGSLTFGKRRCEAAT